MPVVSYRYRTKGQQWLWLETRFELLNGNGFNCKNYTIQAHNKVITLDEMFESHQIRDMATSTTSIFDESVPLKMDSTLLAKSGAKLCSINFDESDLFDRKSSSSSSSSVNVSAFLSGTLYFLHVVAFFRNLFIEC